VKVLLVGMDGAHIDVFKRGWTPFISSLIEKGNQLNIKNDLISRGWFEIVSGEHASVTGALYDKPKGNGTLQWEKKFSINDTPGLGTTIKPIWQVLNENGYKVGIMNVPTTYPAPKVDGFFVSGGGGGAPVVEIPTKELCYPKEILDILLKNEYIIDERIVQIVVDKKVTKPNEIFTRMHNKNKTRTKNFIELANQFNIDFGFVVYRSSTVLVEHMLLNEWKRVENPKNKLDEVLIKAGEEYYRNFDNEIKQLKEAFPDTEIVFVADHGFTKREFNVNPNILLQELGLQTKNSGKSIKKIAIEKLKEILPFSLKIALKKYKKLNSSVISAVNFDSFNTKAFCHTVENWLHGIFINDKERFGGPVDPNDILKIKKEIIEKFNSHPESIKHNLKAYSLKESSDNIVKLFPDIVIDAPSGYLTTNTTDKFISKYTPPSISNTLDCILKGHILGLKSREPISVDCGNFKEEDKKLYDGRDLTAIYDLVLQKFNMQRE
jgi:predicted AlkP superfamily phosphohydrolase/phosphomutase